MAELSGLVPCKLFCSVLAGSVEHVAACEDILAGRFGPVDLHSATFSFARTAYYEKDMGPGLLRRFLSFAHLVDPERLAEIKILTNELEKSFPRKSGSVSRPINLDPGLMARGRMILASTKDFSHRICIGRGIFAEVTLQFKKDQVITLPWTYPDYATGEYDDFFIRLRRRYHQQLEESKKILDSQREL